MNLVFLAKLGRALLKLAPYLFQLILLAERAKGAKTGPEKKQLVLDGAKAALDGTNAAAKVREFDTPEEQAKVLSVVDKGVDLAVAVANAVGLFTKAPAGADVVDATASGGA
jgi:hypothetical protein